jgi:Asp/Glu/hydantoin racemase
MMKSRIGENYGKKDWRRREPPSKEASSMSFGKDIPEDGTEVICDGCGECIGMTENLADDFGFLDCITVEDGTKRETLHFCDWECFFG